MVNNTKKSKVTTKVTTKASVPSIKIVEKVKNQSQKFGFDIEKQVKEKSFKIPFEGNDTNIHDIESKDNKFNNNENISIKTSKIDKIELGDIERVYKYNFEEINTILLILYTQKLFYKVITEIREYNYTKEMHNKIFGKCPLNTLNDYVNKVKELPKHKNGKELKEDYFDYLEEKKKIQKKYDMELVINPKVDSKTQRRVQCTVKLKDIEEFLTLNTKVSKDEDCIVRGEKITRSYNSPPRKRNVKK
jgi:hypothetical protein